MNIATIILQLAFIAFFSTTGAFKLLAHHHMVEEFDKFSYPHWLMRLAGALELVAAVFLILGYWNPIYAALGASLLTAVMIGACYTNFAKRPAVYGGGTMVIVLLSAALAAHFGMLVEFNERVFHLPP
jgi:uncharacterized membrane protein YphA (DoxX/SURF4 family)